LPAKIEQNFGVESEQPIDPLTSQRKHDSEIGFPMALKTILSQTRAVTRPPRRRSTQPTQREPVLRQAISFLDRWRERMRMRRQLDAKAEQ
jgi:uncharacterized protein YjiS (DUF1127 family)